MTKRNKGFTLIELLVVISIIGILSSVVLASLNSARKKARDARRVSDIKQLQLALEVSFDENGAYPTVLNTTTLTSLPVIPTDPVTAAAYSYAALGSGADCTSYHLGATLEESTNAALTSDADAPVGTACTGSAADFAGDDPLYDVKP